MRQALGEGGDEPPLRLRGDGAELFAAYSAELTAKVARNVRASAKDVEDACAFAWLQFLRCQPDRDRSWEGWLFRTAQRQAWHLNAPRRETVAIVDREQETATTAREPADPRDRMTERLELQAALQEVRRLPPRLQAVMLLTALQRNHQQVGEMLGVSRSRVAQPMQSAGAHLTAIAERRFESERSAGSPRAARLRALEDAPPVWLPSAIGRPPKPGKSAAGLLLAWRRGALAIDDFRRSTCHDSPTDALGPQPIEPAARRRHVAAQVAIERVAEQRTVRARGHGHGHSRE